MTLLRKLFARLYAAATHFVTDDGPMVAAGTAYYLALSFFPLLLVLVAGLGLVLEWTQFGQDARASIMQAIGQQASPELANEVSRALTAVSKQAPTGGPIGFVVLVISAIAIFAQLDAGFDRIWGLPANHSISWWQWGGRLLLVRLKALLMLMGAGGFVIAVMIASMIVTALEPRMEIQPALRWMTSVGINLLLNIAAFAAIYLMVPRVRIRMFDALRGGILAAVLWEGGRQALSAYLLHLNYPSAYGVIGSFIAIMLWAYYATLVIFYGAEYVRVLWNDRQSAIVSIPASP
jgi:membrane protein